jgi:hypothetical protein
VLYENLGISSTSFRYASHYNPIYFQRFATQHKTAAGAYITGHPLLYLTFIWGVGIVRGSQDFSRPKSGSNRASIEVLFSGCTLQTDMMCYRKVLETLIFRVKQMLQANNLLAAFWLGTHHSVATAQPHNCTREVHKSHINSKNLLGNLKHRNTRGEEVSSQVMPGTQDSEEQDQEERGDSLLPSSEDDQDQAGALLQVNNEQFIN